MLSRHSRAAQHDGTTAGDAPGDRPLPPPLPCPLPWPLPPSVVVVVGGSTTVEGGADGAVLQSATGIAQEALVVTSPSGQAAVAYTVTVE